MGFGLGVELRAYARNGRPDPRFGRNGVLVAETSPKRRFRMAAVDRDSRGRIVVAGTARGGEGNDPGAHIEVLRIR